MLADMSMRYIISQMKKGRGTGVVAKELKATQRHVQRLWAEYLKTGKAHVQGRAGRPKKPPPSDEEARMVLDAHRRWPDGVQLTARRLRRAGCDTSYARVYAVKSHDLVTASPAKSRQHKRVMYERIYSNATWHTDWRVMKDPRMKGLNPITCLDDASRCVTGPNCSGKPLPRTL